MGLSFRHKCPGLLRRGILVELVEPSRPSAHHRADGPSKDLEVEECRAAIQVLGVKPELRRQDLLPVSLIGIGPRQELCLVVVGELCETRDPGFAEKTRTCRGSAMST